ncbi:MAG: hypothetical protein JWM21_4610 [Acidobacteria bacterium]|nr:hypothetical protein [Acidobacteriota bacterium]
MTQKELIYKISRLPIAQQVEILKVIVQLVADEIQAGGGGSAEQSNDDDIRKLLDALRSPREHKEGFSFRERFPTATGLESEGRPDMRLSQRLYGILKFDGEPPTDDEIKDSRADYLTEKYS